MVVVVSKLFEYVTALSVGVVFGIAFSVGKVHEVEFVRHQLDFSTMTMLKMFLGAMLASVIVFEFFRQRKSMQPSMDELGAWSTVNAYRGLYAANLGAGLVGVGMYFSGSCPGTVYAQMGAGSTKAYYVFAGGLLGVVVYSVLDNNSSLFRRFQVAWKPDPRTAHLHTLVGVSRQSFVFVVVACLSVLLVWVESAFPYKAEYARLYTKYGEPVTPQSFQYNYYPSIAGFVIGLLQFPLIAGLRKTLGSATSYCTVVSNLLEGLVIRNSAHLKSCKSYYWQLVMMCGITLGSHLFSTYTNTKYMSDAMVTEKGAVLGGAIFAFGARMAGGCTSGFGLTGMGHLSTLAMCAVMSMFAGGILTKAVIDGY